MTETATTKIPTHIAIIMDGNGRWAQRCGLPRLRGHEEGARSVRAVVKACRDAGVKYLTLYAFSVENWVRPKVEIAGLMRLLRRFLRSRERELRDNKVRLRVMGRVEDFPAEVREELARVIKATESRDSGHLILALSYGGRAEIARAAREIARRVQAGEIAPAQVDENMVARHLYLPDVPDPDLLIRTGGEMRISNFLLWQVSYTELYVTPVLWPDFREKELHEAIAEYGRRQRRFGGIDPARGTESR
ncbi:MAG: isoprenyl transferase [Verrucomicrobiota bacterium]|nr:isoprenyl transferase [Verrucomicrobiota bacterium]